MKLKFLFISLAAAACLSAFPRFTSGGVGDESAENAALFDGAAKYAVNAGAPAPAPEDKAQLTAELKKHITLNDHGDPAQKRALDAMISRMMDSPAAREMAVKFIKADAKAEVSFETIPGSTVVTVEGRKTIWGTRGVTNINEDPPRVSINSLLMDTDKDMGAATLAHEMLGHAFERQQVDGAMADFYQYNTDEEENARLIGWQVGVELNVKPDDETWAYMQNPDANREALKMMCPYYSLTLTSEEMKDPVPVYKERLAEADKAQVRLIANEKKYGVWVRIVAHFTGPHKKEPATFQSISDDLKSGLDYIPVGRKNLKGIKEALGERITYFSSREGKAFLEKLAAGADSDYFKQKDAGILARRARLEGLLLGKSPESFRTPPSVAQVTWDQLVKLWSGDAKPCPLGAI